MSTKEIEIYPLYTIAPGRYKKSPYSNKEEQKKELSDWYDFCKDCGKIIRDIEYMGGDDIIKFIQRTVVGCKEEKHKKYRINIIKYWISEYKFEVMQRMMKDFLDIKEKYKQMYSDEEAQRRHTMVEISNKYKTLYEGKNIATTLFSYYQNFLKFIKNDTNPASKIIQALTP